MRLPVVLSVAVFVCVSSTESCNGNVLLREYPFLMSHRSGTAYGTSAASIYFDTQARSVTEQLQCGANALDMKLDLDNAVPVVYNTKYTLKAVLLEVQKFLEQNSGFVLIHANGTPEANVKGFVVASDVFGLSSTFNGSQSGLFNNMTLVDAKERGKQKSGGSVLVLFDFVEYNESKEVACYKMFSKGLCPCYKSSKARPSCPDPEVIQQSMWDKLHADAIHAHSGLWVAQGFWHEDIRTIFGISVFNSSRLLDESRAFVNTVLVGVVENAKYLNLLAADNVCGGDKVLQKAIKARRRLVCRDPRMFEP